MHIRRRSSSRIFARSGEEMTSGKMTSRRGEAMEPVGVSSLVPLHATATTVPHTSTEASWDERGPESRTIAEAAKATLRAEPHIHDVTHILVPRVVRILWTTVITDAPVVEGICSIPLKDSWV